MARETHVNVGGSWERAREVYVKVGGSWRFVTEVWTRVAGVWEQVYADFEVTKSGDAAAFDATVTNLVTAQTAGGGSPYSYSWARLSGDSVPQISSTTAATVNWTVPSTGNYDATWRCTVTDAYGKARSVDVGVIFTDLN